MNKFEAFPIASFLVLIFLVLGRIIYLKRKGILVSSNSLKKSKTKILINAIFGAILLLWIFELSRPVLLSSFSILPENIKILLVDSFFMKIAGFSIITFSLVILLATLLHFKNSLRFGLDENNRGKLVTTGIFAISRNPFFLSLDFYFLGVAILLPSIFLIGFSVLAIISIHFFILKEEKFMRKTYGDEYEKYAQKVRRYF